MLITFRGFYGKLHAPRKSATCFTLGLRYFVKRSASCAFFHFHGKASCSLNLKCNWQAHEERPTTQLFPGSSCAVRIAAFGVLSLATATYLAEPAVVETLPHLA